MKKSIIIVAVLALVLGIGGGYLLFGQDDDTIQIANGITLCDGVVYDLNDEVEMNIQVLTEL